MQSILDNLKLKSKVQITENSNNKKEKILKAQLF